MQTKTKRDTGSSRISPALARVRRLAEAKRKRRTLILDRLLDACEDLVKPAAYDFRDRLRLGETLLGVIDDLAADWAEPGWPNEGLNPLAQTIKDLENAPVKRRQARTLTKAA